MPRYDHAVLGGTFDRFHVGHEVLLAAAFRAGRRVSIGLTTAGFLEDHPKPDGARIQAYTTRRRALARWLTRHYPRRPWRIVPLRDPLGRSVEPGVDLLVVSAETQEGAERVNAERRRRGLPAVPVLAVPLVLADDLEPVSSRRIRRNAIDRDGGRRAPLSVGVVVGDARDLAPAVRGVRRAFPSARVVGAIRPRDVGGAPARRARAFAERAIRGRSLSVGIARGTNGLWVVERSATTGLRPHRIAGRTEKELERGVTQLLSRRRG